MNDYDVAKCATQCTNKFGCVSFNIYFERDPSGKQIFNFLTSKTQLTLDSRSQRRIMLEPQLRDHDQVCVLGWSGMYSELQILPTYTD